jgi:hypothetical protein
MLQRQKHCSVTDAGKGRRQTSSAVQDTKWTAASIVGSNGHVSRVPKRTSSHARPPLAHTLQFSVAEAKNTTSLIVKSSSSFPLCTASTLHTGRQPLSLPTLNISRMQKNESALPQVHPSGAPLLSEGKTRPNIAGRRRVRGRCAGVDVDLVEQDQRAAHGKREKKEREEQAVGCQQEKKNKRESQSLGRTKPTMMPGSFAEAYVGML